MIYNGIESRIVRSFVKDILIRPFNHNWSLKALGCIRCNLPNHMRLSVWDFSHRSVVDAEKHTHPWRFKSLIVCGQLTNTRYTIFDQSDPTPSGAEWHHRRLVECGPNGCKQEDLPDVWLKAGLPETYEPGDTYTQESDEVHSTSAINGTVTIIEKHGDSSNEAEVFYRNKWCDAYERKPTMSEIESACNMALGYLK